MKIKLFFLLSIFMLLIVSKNKACSCFPYDYIFCETLEEVENLTLVSVTSVEFVNNFLLKVKVIEELNNGFGEDTLIVFGQDGVNCGQNLTPFAIGDSMILALDKMPYFSLNPSDTMALDSIYYLDGCRLHYLNYSNNMVTGTITENINSLNYLEFQNQISNCVGYIGFDNFELNNVEIFPIPANDFIKVESEKALDKIEVYNSNGKLIMQNLIANQNTHKLNTADLNKGIYLIKVYAENKYFTKVVPIMN